MVTGEPPSTLDGGQCKVTVDFEAEVKVRLEGGAGGTPLFRLTEKIQYFLLGVGDEFLFLFWDQVFGGNIEA